MATKKPSPVDELSSPQPSPERKQHTNKYFIDRKHEAELLDKIEEKLNNERYKTVREQLMKLENQKIDDLIKLTRLKEDALQQLIEDESLSVEELSKRKKKLETQYSENRKNLLEKYKQEAVEAEDYIASEREKHADEMQKIEAAKVSRMTRNEKKLYDKEQSKLRRIAMAQRAEDLKTHKEAIERLEKEREIELSSTKLTSAQRKELENDYANQRATHEDAYKQAFEEQLEYVQQESDYQLQVAKEKIELASKLSEADAKGASKLYDEIQKAKSLMEDEAANIRLQLMDPNISDDMRKKLTSAGDEIKAKIDTASNNLSSVSIDASIEQSNSKINRAKQREQDALARQSDSKAMAAAVEALAAENRAQAAEERVQRQAERQAEWAYTKSIESMRAKRDAAFTKALNDGLAQATKAIDDNISAFYQYQAEVDARLQGSDESYTKALASVKNHVGFSGVVSQKTIIENIKKLSDEGIAYNIEQRAFLASVSTNIAKTFDVFDSNLMRLIRLQQADTTAARLGMEASLIKLFNQYFSDTSYLSDVADSVSESILEATSQLSRDASAEFDFIVQKWLGSLYSVGFSKDTISTIAEGLNYLGTGDIEKLSGNDSLMTLMAMSASYANLPLGEILTEGLNASSTNKLLQGMIEYLMTIAKNTESSQVVKSAYSDVFGVNMSDLRALLNLNESDISNLSSQTLGYSNMLGETQSQVDQLVKRIPFPQMITTMFENVMSSVSIGIGNNTGLLTTWKVMNTIKDLTGGIDIPAISVFGSGVDLNTTVMDLGLLGVAGLSLMGQLFSGLGNGFGLDPLSSWDFSEYTKRGSGTVAIAKGVNVGFSKSSDRSDVGSSSSSDMKNTTLSDGADSADEDKEITNKHSDDPTDTMEEIHDAIFESSSTTALSKLKDIEAFLKADFWPAFNLLAADVSVIKSDVSIIKADVSAIKSDVSSIDDNVATMLAHVVAMNTNLASMLTLFGGVVGSRNPLISDDTSKISIELPHASNTTTDNESVNIDPPALGIHTKPELSGLLVALTDKDKPILVEVVGGRVGVFNAAEESFSANIGNWEGMPPYPTIFEISKMPQIGVSSIATPVSVKNASNNSFIVELNAEALTPAANVSNSSANTLIQELTSYDKMDTQASSSNLLAKLKTSTDAKTNGRYDDLYLGLLGDIQSIYKRAMFTSSSLIEQASFQSSISNIESYKQGVTATLATTLTQLDEKNIKNLLSQTQIGSNSTKALLDSQGMKVNLNQMSPEVAAYFATTIKTMVSSALTGGTTIKQNGQEVSIVELIVSAIQQATMNVRVTNDYFDSSLLKTTML